MGNDISRQVCEGELRHPSYIDVPIAQLKEHPWKPALATHERAAEDWKNRMTGIRSDQQISFQAYALYLIRFIFPAHLVSDWEHFGGISAQLNSFPALLNLAAVENDGVAIAYDGAIRKHCSTLARQRRSDVDFGILLSGECQEIKKQVYSARSQNSPLSKRGKGKKEKRNRPRNWLGFGKVGKWRAQQDPVPLRKKKTTLSPSAPPLSIDIQEALAISPFSSNPLKKKGAS